MQNKYDYDVVIIGAGPGGYVAGIRASQLGLKAAVIEKDKPGGVCLNIGCIPSKALIHQAEIFSSIKELKEMGVSVDTTEFDYKRVFKKSRRVADTLSRGVNYLLKKNNVDLIEGEGKIKNDHEVVIDNDKTITGKNIIIATGSRPKIIKGFEFDHDLVLSSNDGLMMEELPKSVVILGAGAIGVEFAHVMNDFGVEVTLVELMERILPLEDKEVVDVLYRSFKRRGIKIFTGLKATHLKKNINSVSVTVEDSDNNTQVIEADKILVVVGRTINTDNIGLFLTTTSQKFHLFLQSVMLLIHLSLHMLHLRRVKSPLSI